MFVDPFCDIYNLWLKGLTFLVMENFLIDMEQVSRIYSTNWSINLPISVRCSLTSKSSHKTEQHHLTKNTAFGLIPPGSKIQRWKIVKIAVKSPSLAVRANKFRKILAVEMLIARFSRLLWALFALPWYQLVFENFFFRASHWQTSSRFISITRIINAYLKL